jgi:hypothetical protein
MWNVKKTYILETKWKLFATERKTTLGQPNLGNPLTEEIASYKAVVLTYPFCNSCTLNSKTYLYVSASQPDHLSERFFNGLL